MKKLSTDSSLFRVIEKVVPESKEELMEKINSGEKLNVKFGTDPTWADMHFWHAVNLWALRWLQDLWHKVDLIIWDATAYIGDPTWRNKERPEMSHEEINSNAEKFLWQISLILSTDPEVFALHRNSEWYKDMDALDFIWKVMKPITLSKLIERKTFKDRIANELSIHGNELVYQLLQWYDSVHLKSDVVFCWDDQLTNEIMGRTYQSIYKQSPQSIVTTKITPGIDGGAKQSKSVWNYIGLNHSPAEQFRRIMSIPDNLIPEYFAIYTDLVDSEIKMLIDQYKSDLRGLKVMLAKSMLTRYHSDEVIGNAYGSYEKTARNRAPNDIKTLLVNDWNIDLVTFWSQELWFSKNQFRNLIKWWAVSINGTKVGLDKDKLSCSIELGDETILKYWKNKWIKLQIS